MEQGKGKITDLNYPLSILRYEKQSIGIKALEDNEELLNWSLALDFDEYDTNWTRWNPT